jgi:hypothetical protein
MFALGPPLWAGGGDPFGANVLSLLHFDGTNGSTTFTDQVPGRTWGIGGGSPTISTAQSQFGGSSLNVPISSSVVLSAPGIEWLMSGDFSIECWMYCKDNGGLANAFVINTSTSQGVAVGPTAGGTSVSIALSTNAVRSIGDGGGSIYNRWVHVYAGRQGTTTHIACNGVMASTAGETANMTGTITAVTAGSMAAVGGTPLHYIDELRVTKGVCRHTASFTPPTAPYPNP